MAICPNCGQTIPDRARFCPECGANIGEALQKQARFVHDAPAYPPQTPARGGRGCSLAGLILSLFGLTSFLGGLFTFCLL